MNRFQIREETCPRELRRGLAAIQAEYPLRFTRQKPAPGVSFERLPAGTQVSLSVDKTASGIRVRYDKPIHAFRALGRLLGEERPSPDAFRETARFDMLGVMLDVSRNAVLTEQTARSFLSRFALMGIDTLMLYAEDTYEVPGEPFFGYLRGAYSQAEMRRIDRCAADLGIEMFPCIQTLAHLEEILQWPAYASVRDTAHVLLAEEEKTYALVEKIIQAASAPFRSRRIHLGMDEAHGIGTGEYQRRNGNQEPFEILNRHLARVRGICRRLGLKPMIWSDMYFRLGSKAHDYYDQKTVIPPRVARKIPRDVQLVYWDYYHHTPAFYLDWIERHRRLGSEPLVATGIWTWGRFWCAMPYTLTNVEACLRACKTKGIREVIATIWGDDGGECDLFSALPGLQHFAEHGYQNRVDSALLRANFRGSCNAHFDDWCRASGLDSVPCLARADRSFTNVGKWLLWQDPLLAVMEPQLEGVSLHRHYARLATQLRSSARRSPQSHRLLFPAALAAALSSKCDLHRNLSRAYEEGSKTALRQFLRRELPVARKAVVDARRAHRAMWFATYKPFGWEVIDTRYGGLLARLDTVADRVRDFVEGRIKSIPELEAKPKMIYAAGRRDLPFANYDRVATPSCLK